MSPSQRMLEIGWSLFANLMVLVGVVWWGLPPGNVFPLFWVENVILGVVTVIKIRSAQASGEPGRPWFFALHYGIFAVVHGVFVSIVAVANGFSLSFWALGFPIVLIAIRYLADLVTVWFLGGLRRQVSPLQAFTAPYPRLVVLHLATILGFASVVAGGPLGASGRLWWLASLRDWLAANGVALTGGGLVVAMLMLIKSVADVMFAGRTLNLRTSAAVTA